MLSILKTLSRETAPYALIAMITSVVTMEDDLYSNEVKVEKVLRAIREFNAIYPSQMVTVMLENYDERRKEHGR